MILSTNIISFANEIAENGEQEPIEVKFVESFDDVEVVVPEIEEVSIDDLYQTDTLAGDIEDAPMDLNLEDGISIEMPTTYGTQRSVTQKFEGTLSEANSFSYLTLTLAPTQIVTATLECPKSEDLNYDLYIYKLSDDGVLEGTVAGSTTSTYFNKYKDGTQKTIDEGAAFINNTSTTNQYAVMVAANGDADANYPYYLTVSLDVAGGYDGAEPNDSPYTAYELPINKTLSGATLHVVNDQDWFEMPDTVDFRAVLPEVTEGYKAEVYHANGSSMILNEQDSDGAYKINRGVNYVRVFADEADFVPSAYTLKLKGADAKPAQMIVEMNGDEGKDSYPEYPQGDKYLRFKTELTPEVRWLTENGYFVANVSVIMDWESGAWSEVSGRKYRSTSAKTGSDGIARLSLTTPNALGSYFCVLGGPKYFTHYYDIDTVTFSFYEGSVSGEAVRYVYHFSHSDYIGG